MGGVAVLHVVQALRALLTRTEPDVGLAAGVRVVPALGALSLGAGSLPSRLPSQRFLRVKRAGAALARHRVVALVVATRAARVFQSWCQARSVDCTKLTINSTRQVLLASPRQDCSTALFTLAAELPAAILARVLGVQIQVAVRCQKASAGDWASYTADVSRRVPENQ